MVTIGLSTAVSAQSSPTVIAEKELAGGLVPTTIPAVEAIQVLDDGEVIAYRSFTDGHTLSTKIATLEPIAVAAMLAAGKDLPQADLVLANPDAIPCMDAPSLRYRVRNGQSALVDLKGSTACRDEVRPDQISTNLPAILDGFWDLGALSNFFP
jgi:hypothetical protein